MPVWGTYTQTLLNIFYPAQCLYCQELVIKMGSLCGECWRRLSLIYDLDSQRCCQCGKLHGITASASVRLKCLECQLTPPAFHKILTLFVYEGIGKELIHRLKYQDQPYLGYWLGRWLGRYYKSYLYRFQGIIPIPLHHQRLKERRFNQAQLIAKGVAEEIQLPCLANRLIRVKHTSPQMGSSRNERQKNIRFAFELPKPSTHYFPYRKIILIDDVITTGATVNAAAEIFQEVGVQEIIVLAVARTELF